MKCTLFQLDRLVNSKVRKTRKTFRVRINISNEKLKKERIKFFKITGQIWNLIALMNLRLMSFLLQIDVHMGLDKQASQKFKISKLLILKSCRIIKKHPCSKKAMLILTTLILCMRNKSLWEGVKELIKEVMLRLWGRKKVSLTEILNKKMGQIIKEMSLMNSLRSAFPNREMKIMIGQIFLSKLQKVGVAVKTFQTSRRMLEIIWMADKKTFLTQAILSHAVRNNSLYLV